MLILGIDTSTETFSLAISDGEKLLGELFLNVGLVHSQNIIPAMDNLLKQTKLSLSQIQGIAVTIGPGSFTGIRIGLAVAKTISNTYKIPVCGISTLDVLAANLINENGFVCPMISASADYVYDSAYEIKNHKLKKIKKYSFERIQQLMEFLKGINQQVYFVGSGAMKFKDLLTNSIRNVIVSSDHLNYPRASVLNYLSQLSPYRKKWRHHREIKPIYLKPLILHQQI